MTLQHIFKNKTDTIQLSDLDDNFEQLDTTLTVTKADVDNFKTKLEVVDDNVNVSGNLNIATGKTIQGDQGSVYIPGTIIQVVQTVKTDTFSAAPGAGNWAELTGLTATITPKLATSKILVSWTIHIGYTTYQAKGRLKRNGTPIAIADEAGIRPRATFVFSSYAGGAGNDQYHIVPCSGRFLDSPNSTTEQTYAFDVAAYSTNTVYVNRNAGWRNTAEYDASAISDITLMEIAG